MARFAQIDNNVVTATIDRVPAEVPAGRMFVDISALPSVQGGETYDNGIFTPPTPLATTTIDTRAFFRRWTKAERARVRAVAKQSDDIADLSEELRMGGNVDLSSPRMRAGMRALKAIMIPSVWATDAIAEARITELLS